MRGANAGKRKEATKARRSFLPKATYLYSAENDNKQVVKRSLDKTLMRVAGSCRYGKGDRKNEFNAEIDKSGKYGEKDDVVLKLTPKQPSAQYKNLYLVVSPKDFHVSQSVIVDSSNNVNHFRFYEPDFKSAV